LAGFTNLEELVCSNNSLTKLDLHDCQHLTKLNCSFNKLTDVHFLTSLPNLSKLTYLNLEGNNLDSQSLQFLRDLDDLEIYLGSDSEEQLSNDAQE